MMSPTQLAAVTYEQQQLLSEEQLNVILAGGLFGIDLASFDENLIRAISPQAVSLIPPETFNVI